MKKKRQTPNPPPILCWDVYAQLLYKIIREKKKHSNTLPETKPNNKQKQ